MRASVIIPTRGRPVALEGAIRSLLAIDPRKSGVEMIVVDNNSDVSVSSDLRVACAAVSSFVYAIATCRSVSFAGVKAMVLHGFSQSFPAPGVNEGGASSDRTS